MDCWRTDDAASRNTRSPGPISCRSPTTRSSARELRAASIAGQEEPAHRSRARIATFYFENYDTMWLQVQEMLRIEKGGDEQIDGRTGSLQSADPAGPRTDRDPDAGDRGCQPPRPRTAPPRPCRGQPCSWRSAADRIKATPTEYEDRTTPDGKTSSVHWLRFAFTPAQIAAFKSGEGARRARHRPCELRSHGRDAGRHARSAGGGFGLRQISCVLRGSADAEHLSMTTLYIPPDPSC